MANEITIQAAQEKVDNWIKTVGVKYFSELTNLGILMEEVGELSRILVRKYGDQSFKNKEGELLLADEMADVLFVLICLANQTGVDLTTALEKNIEMEGKQIDYVPFQIVGTPVTPIWKKMAGWNTDSTKMKDEKDKKIDEKNYYSFTMYCPLFNIFSRGSYGLSKLDFSCPS